MNYLDKIARMTSKQNKKVRRINSIEVSNGDKGAESKAVSWALARAGAIGVWPGTMIRNGSNYDFSSVVSGSGNFDLTPDGVVLDTHEIVDSKPSNIGKAFEFDGASHMYHTATSSFNHDATETAVKSGQRGLTVMAWVYHGIGAGTETYMAQCSATSGNRSWQLLRTSSNTMRFRCSQLGSIWGTATHSTATLGATEWAFVWGTYERSTSIRVGLNDTSTQVTTAIPGNLHANTTPGFTVGCIDATSPTSYFTGQMWMPMIFGRSMEVAEIQDYFSLTRGIFGV